MTLLSFQTTLTGVGEAGDEPEGRGRMAIVALNGELDVAGAELLENELGRIAADHETTDLVLDLRELEFMDSTGLRLIVIADERARAAGHRLVLVKGRPDVQRVFEITRMIDRLTIVDDPSEAGA